MLIRLLPFLIDSDEKPEFPEESRHSAGKQFFDSHPLTDANGHHPSQFHPGQLC